MSKTIAWAEGTFVNVTEPFTVMLTNEAQQFATDSNRKVTSAQSYHTDIIVIRGSQERTDYTIGNITSGSGITVSKNSKRVTFSVSAGTTIGADTGVIEIPITLDGQTVKKQFSWSCGKQGPQGVKGENGSNFAWNLVKGTGTPKEFKPQANLDNSSTVFYMLDLSDNLPSLGDKFTISCDIEWTQFTQGTGGTFSWWFQGSVDGGWIYDNLFTTALRGVQPSKDTLLSSSGSKHLSASCTIGAALVGKKVFEIGARFNYSDGTGKIKISNLKIAKEDKESPWCLHPDELKGATGDKGKSVQSVIEYYLATSASTGVTTSTSGWSTDPTTQKLTAEKKYLWNCKQTVYDDGTRGSITSPVICGTYGDKGDTGQKGQDGTSIKITSKSVTYQTSTSGTTAPTGTWSTTVPTVNNGQYLWTKTTVQYSDGNKTEAYSVSYKGTNGTNGTSVTVSKTEVTYQVSTSGTTAPTGTWSTTMPSCDKGQYLWTKTYVKYSDGKDTTSYSVSYKGVDGEKFSWNALIGSSFLYNSLPNNVNFSMVTVNNVSATAFTTNGLHYKATASNGAPNSSRGVKINSSVLDLKVGDTVTFSCDVKGTFGTKNNGLCLMHATTSDNNSWAAVHNGLKYSTSIPDWTRKSTTHIIPSNIKIESDGSFYLYFYFGGGTGSEVDVYVRNIQLEKGSAASPWAPHPKDLEGRGVSQTVQYYLATSQASGVTSSTSGWSTDITTQKLTADKKYLWNCYQTKYSDGTSEPISTPKVIGVYGDKGQNAKNLSITPSSQYFKSTDGGKTFAPNTITIKPTIQGEINFGKWQYSIDGGVSFTDVVSGQKGLTVSNNVLTVSKDSSLYSDAVTMVTFRAVASDSSFYDTCSIAKIYDVSDIGDGRNLIQKSQLNPIDGAELSLDDYTKNGTVIFTNKSENSGFSFDSYNNYQPNSKYVLSYYFTKTSGTINSFGGFHNGKRVVYTSFFVDDKVYDTASYAGGSSQIGTILNDGKRHRIVVCYTTPDTIATDTSVNYTFIQPGRGNTNPNFGVKIEELKLEKGSSPTGWSPAPEDVQTAILSTKSEISDVSLKVDKNKQAIEQRVEKTTYQQDLTLVKGDINKANEGLNKWRYEIYPKSLFASEYQGKSTMNVFAKNTNLTPSQSVLINDTDLSIAWNYAENYIGYALTFTKFSAAKSVAITFAHDDGAHIYLNGKLIGGSDAYNKNGESLTLGFVKGWNCIEVVVNEGASTEGFKLGTTISAISECQLMNCYYGTPVARQSHITNQLVENTTNIEGVTTTMQKVMTTVGGSDRIDEFVNNYNKTIESEKQFKKTIGETYTTKDEFNGLEIGGRNLLLGTKDFSSGTYKSTNNFAFSNPINGFTVLKAKLPDGQQYYDPFSQSITYEPNTKYTLSFYAKADSTCGIGSFFYNIGNDGKYVDGCTVTTLTTSWKRYSITWATGNVSRTANILPMRLQGTGNTWCYMYGLKFEKGSKATDWTPAPEDNEINGQNLVSNLPANWEQGTFQDSKTNVGCDYNTNKASMTTRIRVKELVPVSGTITISNAYSNQSKKPIQNMITAFDVNKKWLGNSYVSTDWNDFPRIVDMKDAKYIAVVVRYKDESAITPSDISQICLKIERGTSATPFTLAPEDVNGKIVNVETIANQTAKKFEWIVKGGDKSSSMVLTDDFLNIVANNINLTGKVTFNSLSSDAKNEIGKVAQSKVDDLQIGGRNLLVQKNITEGYLSTDGKGSFVGSGGGDQTSDWIDVSGNKYITVTLYEDFTNTNNSGRYCEYDADKNCINTVVYNPRQKSSIIIELKSNTKYIRVTAIECKTRRYKIEAGNKATDWTPAPEDVSQDATNKASQALTDANNYSSNAVNWVASNGSSTTSLNSMVKKWTDGAVSDTTQINGGWIKANTITASKIALADFTNYSQLTRDTAATYGFAVTDDTDGTWFSTQGIRRDQFISETFPCNGGESYLIEYDISTNAKGANNSTDTKNYIGVAIGVYGYTGTVGSNGLPNKATNIWYATRVTGSEAATVTHVKTTITTSTATKQFRIFLQSNGYYFEGTTKIRNLSVRRMYGGTLIVDGSITADKIATDAIKSRNYISSGGTQGSFLNLSDGSFTSPNLSWDSNGNLIASNANLSGLINATKGTVGGWNIATNGLYSGIDENAIKIYSATTYDAQTMYQKQKIQDSFILSQKYINHFVSQQVSVGHNIPYWQTRSFIYNDSQIQLAQSDYCINTSSASNYDAQYSLKDGYISATRIYMEQNITQVGGDVINSSFSIGLDSMMGWCSIQSTKGINIYGNSSRALYVQSNDTSKYNALETEGDVVVNGKIHAVSGDNKIQLNSDNNGSIELYGNTPFIDFHSAYSSADYTCRIIANTPEQLLVCGKLRCDSNIISNNDLIANSWVYAGQNAHYTWQNQLDCYFSCGYYNNTNNVYYYAGYHAFYVNGDSGSGMMYIDTSGVSSRKGFRNSSDERIKQNFSHFDDNFIDTYMNLEPVQYQFKNDTNDKYHFGFKAQQTERILNAYGQESDKSYGICATHAINPEKAEKLYGVKDMHEEYTLAYDELIAPTTYMVQHTYKELESTKNELEQVKQEKADLETRLQAIEAKLGL